MKKKVLFALIALFSCLTTWAYEGDPVDVGGFRFYLSKKVILANQDLPSVNAVVQLDNGQEGDEITSYTLLDGAYSYTAGAVTPVTTLSAVNYYYRKVQIGTKYYYVPFAVGQTSTDYTIIDSKEAWDASYTAEDGVLNAYYTANPAEDLWNPETHSAASYNDRCYTGTIGDDDAVATVEWASSTAQKLYIGADTYYAAIFYDFEPKECALFTDDALTESANKTFNITKIEYVNVIHSWYGAIYAPGAQYPWVAFKPTTSGCKAFGVYDGQAGVPFGENNVDFIFGTGDGQKAWMVASLPIYFDNGAFKITPGVWNYSSNEYVYEGETAGTFDKTKFQIVLIPAAAPAVVDVEEYDISGATVIVKDQEVYSGKNTKAEILSVDLEGTTIMPGSCKIVGYSEVVNNEATDNVVEYPSYVGTWVAYVEVENSGNVSYTGTAISTPFTVTPGQLNVKLTQISKTYGDNDPEPKFYIEGWGLGDDRTNTTIEGLETYIRVDAGEDCYDANRSQIQYNYTLNNAALKAWKNIGTDETPVKKYNYTVTVTEGVLLINPADLTVTVTPLQKAYGTSDPTFVVTDANATGLKNGDKAADAITSIKRAEGEAVNVDPGYAFTVVAPNYNVTVTNAFKITKGVLPNDAIATIKPVQYKGSAYGANDSYEVSINGVKETENWQLANFANSTHVGTATCDVVFDNYEGALHASFQITKAPLLAKGSGTNTNPTVTYSGWKGNDWYETAGDKVKAQGFVPATATVEEIQADEIGRVYTINVTGGSADDYEITREAGTYSIGRTTLYITAEASKVYGDPDPELTISKLVEDELVAGAITVTGFPEGTTLEQQEAILKLNGSKYVFNCTIANPHVNAGRYVINFNGPLVLNDDYAIDYTNGTFTITPAELTIAAQDQSKVYGAAVPTLTAIVSGLKNGDTEAQAGLVNGNSGFYVSLEPEYTWSNGQWVKRTGRYQGTNYEREHVTTTGHEYPITIHGMNGLSNNYTIANMTNGKLTVTPAKLTITPDPKSKTYGDADPALTVTVTGWTGYETAGNNNQNGNRQNAVLTKPNGHLLYKVTRAEGEDVKEGGYTITAENNIENPETAAYVPQDYTIEYGEAATLTINKRNVTVTAKHQAINYGETINPYYMQVNFGQDNIKTLTKGEDVFYQGASVTDQVKDVISLEAKHTEVGSFGEGEENGNGAYTAKYGAKAANYNITFVDGWEVINPAKVLYLDMKDLAKALQDHVGRTVEVKLCGAPVKEEGCDPFRRFGKDYWYSMVLPFNIKVRDISKAFGYAVVDVMDKKNARANSISLAVYVGEVNANQPFVIKVDETHGWTEMAAVTFGQQTIADFNYLENDPTDTDGYNQFIGTYKPKNEFAVGDYIMRENRGNWQPYEEGKTYDMKQTEAYLKSATAGAPLRIIIEEADGTTTVINDVDADAEVAYGEGWYTINGVKLDAEPATSGTYIFNGKKVFIQK